VKDRADERLRRLLGGDALAPLRKRLRGAFERASTDKPIERIRIGGLKASEHAALASLTGRAHRPSSSLEFDVGFVDAILRRSGAAESLRDALEQLDGPIVHLATARSRAAALWSDVAAGCSHPGLAALLQSVAGSAMLKRLARQDPGVAAVLCSRAEAVLERLPARGVPRSQLAAELLGDAHALDEGQAAGTLVLAVARRSRPSSPDDVDDSPTETVREIWAAAGVLVNELARPALFLNLPTQSPANVGGATGEPTYASLRLLLRSPPSWDVAGRPVFVCENPNLLAIAANHWGARCAPLVCTDGMPAAAQRCLLAQLSRAGADLHYHGDFDWAGVRIANHVMREHGATPWRFGVADYMEAAGNASGPGHPLQGSPVQALWDPVLTPTMLEQQRSIAEEAVAASLLYDLGDG
jgi:uncharacterized protein (TIGR02679 family)